MNKKNIPVEFVFQLFALIIAVIVVHAFYVSAVRPNAAQIIAEQNAAAAADPDYIRERSGMIMYGIDARRQRFADETPFDYEPLRDASDAYQWSPEIMPKLKDYNLKDLGI